MPVELLFEAALIDNDIDTLMQREMRNTATSMKRSPVTIKKNSKHVGPLKLEPDYQGPNQFMFRNVGRNTFYGK